MIKNYLRLLLSAFICFLFISCTGGGESGEALAGFGSETTNGPKTALFKLELHNDSLYDMAQISALPVDHNPVLNEIAEEFTVYADRDGKATLSLDTKTSYNIYISNPKTGKKYFLNSVEFNGDTTLLCSLAVPGSIRINFHNSKEFLDTVAGYVYISGYPEYISLKNPVETKEELYSVVLSSVPSSLLKGVNYAVEGSPNLVQELADTVVVQSQKTTDVNATLYYKFLSSSNSSLASDTITAITVDSQGVWMGTNSGLSQYHNMAISHFVTPQMKLENNRITAMVTDNNGDSWIGTEFGLLHAIKNGDTELFTTDNSDIPANRVTSLAVSEGNSIWVGTTEGLCYFNQKSWMHFTTLAYPLPSNSVTALALDSDSVLWGGTDRGLFSFHPDSGIKVYNNSFITTIDISKNNTKWVGTHGEGLMEIDDETWSYYTANSDGTFSNTISSVLVDSSQNVWVASASGTLFRYSDEGWYVFTGTDGSFLPSVEILDLAVDSEDNLYCATAGKGLFLLGPSAEELFKEMDEPVWDE